MVEWRRTSSERGQSSTAAIEFGVCAFVNCVKIITQRSLRFEISNLTSSRTGSTARHLSLIVCVVAPHPSAGATCPSLLLYSYWPTCLCLIAPPCSQFTLRPVLLNNHRPMSCCSKWPRRPARTINRLSSSARPKESLLPSMYTTIRHLMWPISILI